jgi:hypothetical protein
MPRCGVRQPSQRDDPIVDSTIWIEEQARRLRYIITKAVLVMSWPRRIHYLAGKSGRPPDVGGYTFFENGLM